MTRIVTTTYRYKRPAKKRKAVAIAGPAVVRKAKAVGLPTGGKTEPSAPPTPANDDRRPPPPSALSPRKSKPALRPTDETKSAVVTARRPGARRVDVPDLTPEELQRRGEAAGALWRELVRRVTAKDQP